MEFRKTGKRFPFAVLVLLLLGTTGAFAQVQGWDTQTSRTLNYTVDVDMYVDQNNPAVYRELDNRTITMTIGNGQIEFNRTSSLEASSEHFGPYGFNADGSFTILPDDPALPDDQKWPPLEAELLVRVFGSVPVSPTGQSWSFVDRDLSDLSLDKVELQQTTHFTTASTSVAGGVQSFTFSVTSDIMLVDNLALWAMVGTPSERTPELQATISALGQSGNQFLYGTLTWETGVNSSYGKTTGAEFTYVPLPFSGGNPTVIDASIYRQHMVVGLVP